MLHKTTSTNAPLILNAGDRMYPILQNFKEELADAQIRIGDLCASLRIDLESVVNAKMLKNEKRAAKHGRQR